MALSQLEVWIAISKASTLSGRRGERQSDEANMVGAVDSRGRPQRSTPRSQRHEGSNTHLSKTRVLSKNGIGSGERTYASKNGMITLCEYINHLIGLPVPFSFLLPVVGSVRFSSPRERNDQCPRGNSMAKSRTFLACEIRTSEFHFKCR